MRGWPGGIRARPRASRARRARRAVRCVRPCAASLPGRFRPVIHDAELFTVGPDEVVVTFRTDDEREVETMVGDIAVTTSGRYHAARVTGLDPDTTYPLSVEGAASSPLLPPTATTLPDPPG